MGIKKIISGAAASVAAIALLASPAFANNVNIKVTDGTIYLFDEFYGPVGDVDLGGSGVDCDPNLQKSEVTTSGDGVSGSVEAIIRSDSSVTIGSEHFRASLTTQLNGTYSGVTPYYIADNGNYSPPSNQAVALLWKQATPGGCDQSGDPCVITASALRWDGILDSLDPSNLQPGDSAEVDGENSSYETTVTGPAQNCGGLIALNNGSVQIVGGAIEVTV